MPKFRKKPIVIEAERFLFAQTPWPEGVYVRPFIDSEAAYIDTLEGPHLHVSDGDWIITGVQGERYPCKPDIFEKTYEPADTPPSDTATEVIQNQARIDATEAWKSGRPVMDEREREHPEWFQDRFDEWADYQARLRGDRYVAASRRAYSKAFYREVVTLALEHEAATLA